MTRAALISAITTFLADREAQVLAELRASLEHEIDAAGPDAFARLDERLADAADGWNYYAPDPLARRIHHVLARTDAADRYDRRPRRDSDPFDRGVGV